MMKSTFLRTIGTTGLAILTLVTFAQISGFAQEEIVGQDEGETQIQDESYATRRQNRRALEGTWNVQVTVRNCQTGAAIRTFPAMGTFMRGGTALVSESGISSALKTPAHGFWNHITGNAYRFKTKAFNFDASGNFTGWIIINNETRINRGGDEFTSTGAAEVYAPNGSLIFTGCSTLAAAIFQ